MKNNDVKPAFAPASEGKQKRQTGYNIRYAVLCSQRRVQDRIDVQSRVELRTARTVHTRACQVRIAGDF